MRKIETPFRIVIRSASKMTTLEAILEGSNLRTERAVVTCKCCKINVPDQDNCMQFYLKVISDVGEILMSECTKKCVYMCAHTDPTLADIGFEESEFSLLKMLPFVDKIVSDRIRLNLQNSVIFWRNSVCNKERYFRTRIPVKCEILNTGPKIRITTGDTSVAVPLRKDLITTKIDLRDAIMENIRIMTVKIDADTCTSITDYCTIWQALYNADKV